MEKHTNAMDGETRLVKNLIII